MISAIFLRRHRLAIAVLFVGTLQAAVHGQAPTEPSAGAAPQTASDPAPSQSAPPSASSETQAPPAELPGAIYKQAMHPLDVVRSSMDNWSDAELGALAVGIHKAQEACGQMKPKDLDGDNLFDLARLCSFGQDWNDANTAALAYVASHAEAHRAEAYALSVYALVHLNAIDLAVQTAEEMLHKLPYDAEVAYTLRDLKIHLEQTGNRAALTLAGDEHPVLVQAIHAGVPLKAAHGDAAFSVGSLFESGMELAFFERYTGNDDAAASTQDDLERALPPVTSLPVDDRRRIDAVNTQYGLLGKPIPEFEAKRSYQSRTAKAQISRNFGAATVLVLFPDWCVQCRKMMSTLTTFAAVNGTTPIHAYGLMFPDDPKTAGRQHQDDFKELAGTATLLVSPEVASTVGATDFPMGIVTDGSGIARFVGLLPQDAFDGDGYIEKVILRMVATETARKGRIE
jgi:hypothetical protein